MDVSLKDIFQAIPERFNGDAAGSWNADIQFRFANDSGEDCWFVSVADGGINAGEGTVEQPTATILTGAETWIGMTMGSVDPMQAFMTGKLRIEGNMGDVMKLQDKSIFGRA